MRRTGMTIIVCALLLWTRTAQAQTRYVDNGDGTVSDKQTGLMWEKKTGNPGGSSNPGDAHDVNNFYTWSESGNRDGTAFTKFLGTLNGKAGNGKAGCFAHHCDWRLPSVDELKEILLYPCSKRPCIDPIFGPTQSLYYWSASIGAYGPSGVWGVDFADGHVSGLGKPNDNYVRAVRRGL